MGFDWEKYLELAQYLHKNSETFPDKEACCRAAVSRAYYAAYGVVCVYIRNIDGEAFRGGDSHKRIQMHLTKSGDEKKRTIANQLKMIHTNRKKADYNDTFREKPCNLASVATAQAKRIISEVEELFENKSN